MTTDLKLILKKAAEYAPGYSLSRLFYTSTEIFERDLAKVWCESWIWAGHISQVPSNGDYFVFEFGRESVIIVRDDNGTVRAHLNVCRHRGSRVCLERSGNVRLFACPYHGWTYNLDGRLRAGRMMGDNFDPSSYQLRSVQVIVFEGLIFICLSERPPAIGEALKQLEPHLKAFDLPHTRIAHHKSYTVPANWKLAVENYLECYHCAPAHREYSRSHSLKDPRSMTDELIEQMTQKSKQAGLSTEVINDTGVNANPPGGDIYYRRYPLYSGYVTGSREGTPLAPLLGRLSCYDGGATDIEIGPLNYFLVYSDYVVGYRFIPRGLQQTELQTVWMVRDDAVEGVDYHVDSLIWLWDVTTKDDERIIRNNQKGVNSMYYQPGPLAPMEWSISGFLNWYVAMIR